MKPPMVGWIVFAAMMLLVVGSLDAFEGLIAIVRDNYYAIHGDQLIVVDTTTWGWVMLIWGIALFLVGLALWGGSAWARWVAIVLAALNLLGQLGWLGNTGYPLWSLVIVGLNVMIIYALTVRWEGYPDEVRDPRP
jgi:hypothetical protein